MKAHCFQNSAVSSTILRPSSLMAPLLQNAQLPSLGRVLWRDVSDAYVAKLDVLVGCTLRGAAIDATAACRAGPTVRVSTPLKRVAPVHLAIPLIAKITR